MKCAIIAEGKSDQAVLTNILKGQLGIDRSDIIYLQPENFFDETDLNNPNYKMSRNQFSNWELVKNECIRKEKISDFFDNPIDDNRFLIIQIDTAEAHLKNYDVIRPDKKNNDSYVIELRNIVSDKLDEWIGDSEYNIVYAICVEETEAWILTIYTDENKDTGLSGNPKSHLEKFILPKKFKSSKLKEINDLEPFDSNLELSKPFRKNKDLKKYSLKNKSLEYFCSLLDKVNSEFQEI